jgi:ElaB/YqjD/DUF883 family membrane-anchored ribosome-binding protein
MSGANDFLISEHFSDFGALPESGAFRTRRTFTKPIPVSWQCSTKEKIDGQQHGQGATADAAAKVGDKVSDVENTKPALRDLQASAGEAMSEATELARKASDIGGEAVKQGSDAIKGAAREVANQAYQQGGRARESLTQYVAEQPLPGLLIAGAIGYGLARSCGGLAYSKFVEEPSCARRNVNGRIWMDPARQPGGAVVDAQSAPASTKLPVVALHRNGPVPCRTTPNRRELRLPKPRQPGGR